MHLSHTSGLDPAHIHPYIPLPWIGSCKNTHDFLRWGSEDPACSRLLGTCPSRVPLRQVTARQPSDGPQTRRGRARPCPVLLRRDTLGLAQHSHESQADVSARMSKVTIGGRAPFRTLGTQNAPVNFHLSRRELDDDYRDGSSKHSRCLLPRCSGSSSVETGARRRLSGRELET
ncbi:hypothetical protein PYCCODRAFT_1037199 [Trametes coccinea BRFM310]|uniref:Uncharacterized protein n=1 Tax=Trametes coccinea (strain BRFM310) TaxID=1353009 RepID=A0A1Y2IA20_TRAC3|nr:hypothetical protein PYCCODRAFT_1037199 [Trametes coccinea BRFM310]